MITIIIHRDNGYNTCRQCVMEVWNSYFEIIQCESREQAIYNIAKWLAKQITFDDPEYIISVMFVENGEMVVCEDITGGYHPESVYLEELLKDVEIAKKKL